MKRERLLQQAHHGQSTLTRLCRAAPRRALLVSTYTSYLAPGRLDVCIRTVRWPARFLSFPFFSILLLLFPVNIFLLLPLTHVHVLLLLLTTLKGAAKLTQPISSSLSPCTVHNSTQRYDRPQLCVCLSLCVSVVCALLVIFFEPPFFFTSFYAF